MVHNGPFSNSASRAPAAHRSTRPADRRIGRIAIGSLGATSITGMQQAKAAAQHGVYKGSVLSERNALLAACTLLLWPFRQSTESRPVSMARIVQRRAAVQNVFRC